MPAAPLLLVCLLGVGDDATPDDTAAGTPTELSIDWAGLPDRVWAGEDLWANRLQDWRVRGGRLECVEARPGKPLRTVVHTGARLAGGDFSASVTVHSVGAVVGEAPDWTGTAAKPTAPDAAGGLLIGAGPELEPRAAALIHHATGPGAGYFCGITADGRLVVRDLSRPLGEEPLAASDAADSPAGPFRVTALLRKKDGGRELSLFRSHAPGARGTSLRVTLPIAPLGSVGLVSHPGDAGKGKYDTGRWAFSDWRIAGDALEPTPADARLGPILGTKYTLDTSRGSSPGTALLTLQAQLWPLAWEAPADGGREAYEMTARLELDRGDGFIEAATAPVTRPDWTAVFRLEDFPCTADTPYRVVYDLVTTREVQKLGLRNRVLTDLVTEWVPHEWAGTVRQDPAGGRVVLGAFSCNNNNRGSVDRPRYSFTPNSLWHPHTPIRDAALKADPDVCYFAGDQIYEGGSPTGPDRGGENPDSYLDYHYKWDLWVWAYRDVIKDRPTAVVPDDHDVFQGNLWGEGGKPTTKGSGDEGGYFLPPDWVNMVQRTQTGNLPPPAEKGIPGTDITAYYTDMTVGGVSFAVLEDRKFKTGPAGRVPETASGRADHIIEPDYDKARFDDPDWDLLGAAQEDYLNGWAADWAGGVWFKCVLSQSPWAAVATHHGPRRQYLVADLDANGWPRHARDAAVVAARRGLAVMVHGDQHLPTLIRHGVAEHNDAGWAFTVPGTANFYPRWWDPNGVGDAALAADPGTYTGRFEDGFGNKVTVHAAANPGPSGKEPADLHDKKPGWGTVVFERDGPGGEPAVTFNNYPRGVDPTAGDAAQFAGWPRSAARSAMDGRVPAGRLPALDYDPAAPPAVTVTNAATGEVLYTVRPAGPAFRPPVYDAKAPHTVTLTPEAGEPTVLEGRTAAE